jgi:hypothetical protein
MELSIIIHLLTSLLSLRHSRQLGVAVTNISLSLHDFDDDHDLYTYPFPLTVKSARIGSASYVLVGVGWRHAWAKVLTVVFCMYTGISAGVEAGAQMVGFIAMHLGMALGAYCCYIPPLCLRQKRFFLHS